MAASSLFKSIEDPMCFVLDNVDMANRNFLKFSRKFQNNLEDPYGILMKYLALHQFLKIYKVHGVEYV